MKNTWFLDFKLSTLLRVQYVFYRESLLRREKSVNAATLFICQHSGDYKAENTCCICLLVTILLFRFNQSHNDKSNLNLIFIFLWCRYESWKDAMFYLRHFHSVTTICVSCHGRRIWKKWKLNSERRQENKIENPKSSL